MQSNIPVPAILTLKDMRQVTRKSKATVTRLRIAIRKRFDKDTYADITTEEFIAVTGISRDEIARQLST